MEKSWQAAGFRQYSDSQIDVYYHKDICSHSGNCVKGNAHVFDVSRKPWIVPDADRYEAVEQTIDTCPSGALRYVRKEEAL